MSGTEASAPLRGEGGEAERGLPNPEDGLLAPRVALLSFNHILK